MRILASTAPLTSCQDASARAVPMMTEASAVDGALENDVTVHYAACVGAEAVAELDDQRHPDGGHRRRGAPARVKGLRVNSENARVRIRWTPPAVEDLAEVVVVRRLGAAGAELAEGRHGRLPRPRPEVTDFPVSPRARVWYAAFALDDDEQRLDRGDGLAAALRPAALRPARRRRRPQHAALPLAPGGGRVVLQRADLARRRGPEGRLDVDEHAELRAAAQARQGPLLLVRVPRLRAPLARPATAPCSARARSWSARDGRPQPAAAIAASRAAAKRASASSSRGCGSSRSPSAVPQARATSPGDGARERRRPGWPRPGRRARRGPDRSARPRAAQRLAPGGALRAAADHGSGASLDARRPRRSGEGGQQAGGRAVVRRPQDRARVGVVPQPHDEAAGVRQVGRALAVQLRQDDDLAGRDDVLALEPEPRGRAIDR